jgi:hypothetical protein
MAGDVQGVPAGLTEEPIAGSQPQAASAVQGVPAGLQEEPVNSAQTSDTSAQTPPALPSVASRVATGVGQSLNSNIVQPAASVLKSVVTPPEDHKEAIAHMAAGVPGLQLYRLGKYLVDGIENTIDTGKEGYKKGVDDFSRAVQEIGKGDTHGLLA